MDFYFIFFYQCYHCSYCNRIFISFPFAGQSSWNQATWTWTNRRIKLSWQFSRMIYSLLSMLWREAIDTKMNVLVITTGFSVFKSTCEFRMQTPTYAFDSVNYFLNWWNLGGFTVGLNVHLPKSIIFFVNSNHIFQHELNNNVIIFATHNLKMRITDAKENHSNARFHCQTCPSLKLMIKTNAIFAVAKFYTTYLIRF